MIKNVKLYILQNKLRKESFWALIAKLCAAVMGLFLFSLIPRLLGPKDYGIFSLTLSILVLFMLFSDFGLSSSSSKYIAQYVKKDKSQIRNILKEVLLLRIFTLVIVSIIGYFSINFITNIFEMPELSKTLFTGIFVVIFWTLTEDVKRLFQGFHRLKFNFYITFVEFGLKILFSLLFIHYYGLIGALISFLFAYIFATVVGLFYTYKYFYCEFEGVSSVNSFRKEILNYALPMIFISASFYIFTEIDIIFLAFFSTPTEVGYYSVGKQITRYLPIFAAGIGTALGPMYADITRENIAQLKKTYYKIIGIVSCLYLIASVFLFIFAREIIILLYGIEYIPSIIILKILVIYMFFFAISSVVSPLIDYLGMAKKRAIALMIVVMLNIFLNVLLIPKYGGIGAAIATIASYTPYVIANMFICHKHLMNYSQLDKLEH